MVNEQSKLFFRLPCVWKPQCTGFSPPVRNLGGISNVTVRPPLRILPSFTVYHEILVSVCFSFPLKCSPLHVELAEQQTLLFCSMLKLHSRSNSARRRWTGRRIKDSRARALLNYKYNFCVSSLTEKMNGILSVAARLWLSAASGVMELLWWCVCLITPFTNNDDYKWSATNFA